MTPEETLDKARCLLIAGLIENGNLLRQAHTLLRMCGEDIQQGLDIHNQDIEACDCEVALVHKLFDQRRLEIELMP